MADIQSRMKHKRDTASNWTANDPVLLDGEIIVVVTNSGEVRHKTGDGKKKFSELPYDDEAVRSLVNGKLGTDHNTAEDAHANQHWLTSDDVMPVDPPPAVDVQPDWNQNDESAPDHIKNRPFYIGKPVNTILFEDSALEFQGTGAGFDEPPGIASIPNISSIELGKIYTVTFDSVSYVCEAKEADLGGDIPIVYIGNLGPQGQEDTGEPFLAYMLTLGLGPAIFVMIAINDVVAPSSHSVKIETDIAPVNLIPEQYLPIASDSNYGVVKRSEIVTSYNFIQSSAPKDDMNVAVKEFEQGRANIVWYGESIIWAKFVDETHIKIIFSDSPLVEQTFEASHSDSGLVYGIYLGAKKYSQHEAQKMFIYPDGIKSSKLIMMSDQITINNGSGTWTANLPYYSSADEGKVLKIVGGIPTWVALS